MHKLQISFHIRVTSYFLHMSYEHLRTFYEQVTSYYLLQELRVNFYTQAISYHLLHELQLQC